VVETQQADAVIKQVTQKKAQKWGLIHFTNIFRSI